MQSKTSSPIWFRERDPNNISGVLVRRAVLYRVQCCSRSGDCRRNLGALAASRLGSPLAATVLSLVFAAFPRRGLSSTVGRSRHGPARTSLTTAARSRILSPSGLVASLLGNTGSLFNRPVSVTAARRGFHASGRDHRHENRIFASIAVAAVAASTGLAVHSVGSRSPEKRSRRRPLGDLVS